MSKNSYLLVFPAKSAWLFEDAKPVASALNDGDGFYALDGNIGFIKTDQTLEALTARLKAGPIGGGSFFLTHVSDTSFSGSMPARFWSYLHAPDEIMTAAE